MDPLVPHSSHLSLAEQDAGDRSQILLEENMVLQRLGQVTMDSEEPQMTVTQTININREASTESMQTTLDEMQLDVEEDWNDQYDRVRDKAQECLSPPDPSINHDAARRTRHDGTATWFIQGAAYNEWKTGGSVLWIHGQPGSGKSVLCSSVIEDVQRIRATGSVSLAYYYFDFKDVRKQGRRGLLSSLLIQLCPRSRHGYDILSNLIATHDIGLREPDDTDLIRCLKVVLTLPGREKKFIVVDGLDECPNPPGFPKPARQEVLDLLKELVSLDLPDLRICVTSRPEIEIKNSLEPLTSHQMSLHDESGQREAVLDYIRSFIQTDRQMQKWRSEDKQLTFDILSGKAGGMFRWAVCQLDMLRLCFPWRLHQALEELPGSLDETYERILLNIDRERREYAHRLFKCLTVSAYPLRVEELAEIFVMDFGSGNVPNYRPGWRLENPGEVVLSACSSLIAITDVDGSQVVQFSHSSVKEFLTSDRLNMAATNPSWYHIDYLSAHTILAQASLSILLHLGSSVDKGKIEDLPFSLYAARHWVDHVQFEGVLTGIQDSVARLFDMDNPSFATWIWIYDIDHPHRVPMSTAPPTRPEAVPLYYATLCGFRGIVKHLLATHPEEVNAKGGYHTTPLHAAIAKGNFEIAELLIKYGADVDALDREGWSALHTVSRSGRLDNLRFLLEHRADVNVVRQGPREDHGWTPLHVASRHGRVKVVQFLLGHQADVHACNHENQTALHLASQHGDPELMRLLIDHGAKCDAKDEDDETPLFLASRNGRVKATQLLLARHATVDHRDWQKRTPLHAASENGHVDIVRLLLDRGADVNARNVYEWTPLHLASRTGKDKVVKVLLDRPAKDADVNAPNDVGWTALHLASQKGHLDVVELLLDHGANVDTQEVDGETALHLAAYYGHHEVAKVLLKAGANQLIKNKEENTPFDLAKGEGHAADMELLTWPQWDPQSSFLFLPYENETNETGQHTISPRSEDRDKKTMDREGRQLCTPCGKSFGRIQDLRRHQREKHSPAHECQFCGFKWSRPDKFRRHLIESHRSKFSPEVLLEIKTLRAQRLVEFINEHCAKIATMEEATVQSTSSPGPLPRFGRRLSVPAAPASPSTSP